MSDLKALLERADRAVADVPLPAGGLEGIERRRERKQRNRRIRAGVVSVVAALAAGFFLVRSLTPHGIPANPPVEPTPTTPVPVASGALTYSLNGDIYIADQDGSNPVKIVDGIAGAGCTGVGASWSNQVPSWSPDGKYLAFEHACSTSGRKDLMITDPRGDVIAAFPRDGWGFAWSPDSTRVAVWGSFGRTINVYGVDGQRQASLPLPARMAPHYDSGPGEWMPDGSALLLYGVFVVPVDGSAPHDLSLGGEATYSPDGTRVAVVTGHSIVILAADGSRISKVDGPLDSVDVWSPGGERFASLSHGELDVVDAASGTVSVLTEAKAALNGDQILGIRGFSPQGDRILYEAGDGNGGATALWSIAVDGSDARLIVAGTTQGEWLSR